MWKILLIILAVFYALSPFDLMPDALIGWGWLDDLIVLGLVARYAFTLKSKIDRTRRDYGQEARREQQNGGTDRQRAEHGTSSEHRHRTLWNPYQVLGIGRDASPAEIKAAYRRLANQYHPDKVAHLGREFRELAESKFKEIQRAYQELRRPERR